MKLYRFFLPLLVSSPAFAASITDLTVRGLITPTACTPGLSSSGLVDYGKISQQDLKPDRGTRLPIKQLLVTVNCEGLSRFALRMRDNRDGTANVNSEIYYGLGLDGSGNRIGVYSLSFDPKLTDVDALPVVYGTESTTGALAGAPPIPTLSTLAPEVTWGSPIPRAAPQAPRRSAT